MVELILLFELPDPLEEALPLLLELLLQLEHFLPVRPAIALRNFPLLPPKLRGEVRAGLLPFRLALRHVRVSPPWFDAQE